MAIKVADQVWIATALLSREQPGRESFRVREIVDRASAERFTVNLQPGVQVHASQHAVANLPANPGRYRMLYATNDRGRRLFREGDPYHPSREGGKITPRREDIPEQYWDLLVWYEQEYARRLRESFPQSEDVAATPLYDDPFPAKPVLQIPPFEEAVEVVRAVCVRAVSFVFTPGEHSFTTLVEAQLRALVQVTGGVYLVRAPGTGEVLYCGKTGSITPAGEFDQAETIRHPTHVRMGDLSIDEFFRLCGSIAGGTLRVECFALRARPASPSLIQAYLLQSYLNEFGCLPGANGCL